ncbi:alpha/beta fold hydrolase [Pseudochryseolinea flava]|uniref:AB hydrolase-1 domain-containing protein n=1 Tax=Pseudochryseolinea flava TaxID=2059302 RepID=A0A364Y5J1_9BACT|nr:hypothetical protein [Pseudochryseolinea flava]RAW02102.1 hypothetical protein DQQ10_05995 [Pseudochryseolinea flava]
MYKNLTLLFLVIALSGHVAVGQSKKENLVRDQSSFMEWFIAPGVDWQGGPKLYVRTLGYGSDTVVLLHGGWGGEHHTLLDAVRGLEDKFLFVLYDQRGSLRSPFPDSLISFEHHIEDLE